MKKTLKNSTILELYDALVTLEPAFRPPLTLTKEARGAIAHNIYSLDFVVKKLNKMKRGFIREATGGQTSIKETQTQELDLFLEKWEPVAEDSSEVDLEICSAAELSACVIPVVTIARMYPMFREDELSAQPAS